MYEIISIQLFSVNLFTWMLKWNKKKHFHTARVSHRVKAVLHGVKQSVSHRYGSGNGCARLVSCFYLRYLMQRVKALLLMEPRKRDPTVCPRLSLHPTPSSLLISMNTKHTQHRLPLLITHTQLWQEVKQEVRVSVFSVFSDFRLMFTCVNWMKRAKNKILLNLPHIPL